MALLADLRIISALLRHRSAGDSHEERLEGFYKEQAAGYDDFRRRFLHGRPGLVAALDVPAGGTLLDLGGGTGSNIELLGDKRQRLKRITLVDLCPALLRVAEERIRRHGWDNTVAVHADAVTYQPEDGPVDVITFSYSLTMIPDWLGAIDRAYANLKPGGLIGVTDFYVSHKWPTAGMRKHSRFQRHFWPTWFSWDNVFLSPDPLRCLQHRFTTVRLEEHLGRVPYLLGLKAPYYIFVGRKA